MKLKTVTKNNIFQTLGKTLSNLQMKQNPSLKKGVTCHVKEIISSIIF